MQKGGVYMPTRPIVGTRGLRRMIETDDGEITSWGRSLMKLTGAVLTNDGKIIDNSLARIVRT